MIQKNALVRISILHLQYCYAYIILPLSISPGLGLTNFILNLFFYYKMQSEICTKNYYVYDVVSKAIQIVKNYVQETGQILVGGQSIDYALRLKGIKLYEDWELPDLDFQSDDYANVAYEIFAKVASATDAPVAVLNAMHQTTMRVQVVKFAVADVTFVPTRILEMYRQSALMYDGCLIRHPIFQYLDIQRSFSYPYENTMMEVITHRWEKDFKRLLLTMKYYNPSDKVFVLDFIKQYESKLKPAVPKLSKLGIKKNRLNKRMASSKPTSGSAPNEVIGFYKKLLSNVIEKELVPFGLVNGELAFLIYYHIYRKAFKKLAKDDYIKGRPDDRGFGVSYNGSAYFLNSYVMDIDDRDIFFTHKPDLIKSKKDTNPYIDVIPVRTIAEDWELVNVGHKTGYHDINLSQLSDKFPNMTVRVVSINFLILYISMLWITIRSETYLSIFLKLLRMIEKVYNSDLNTKLLFPSNKVYGSEVPHFFELNKAGFKKPQNIYINKYNSLENGLKEITEYVYPEIYNMDGL